MANTRTSRGIVVKSSPNGQPSQIWHRVSDAQRSIACVVGIVSTGRKVVLRALSASQTSFEPPWFSARRSTVASALAATQGASRCRTLPMVPFHPTLFPAPQSPIPAPNIVVESEIVVQVFRSDRVIDPCAKGEDGKARDARQESESYRLRYDFDVPHFARPCFRQNFRLTAPTSGQTRSASCSTERARPDLYCARSSLFRYLGRQGPPLLLHFTAGVERQLAGEPSDLEFICSPHVLQVDIDRHN